MAKKTLHWQVRSLKEPAPPLEATYRSFKIENELGLHARAAALFVKISSRYQSEIKVQKGPNAVNGKSIMGLLMLAASKGSQISISASGTDAPEAIKELGNLIQNKFGEK